MTRDAIRSMTAYTLEVREAETKLNQNELPFDFPADLKQKIADEIVARPWNRYPDFESNALRSAIAASYGFGVENILVGNGSNELLAAAVGTFVGPGTPVVIPRPTFALYEKLVTIAGGTALSVDIDPRSPTLPVDAIFEAAASVDRPVVILCSPNNPTGGILPPATIDGLLEVGATVLFDRAYGDFAGDTLHALDDRLVILSTFSKSWGLAGLRVGWLVTTAATAAEIRKVKLPYSLNIVSETAAIVALANRQMRDAKIRTIAAERMRVARAMRAMQSIEVFPSFANFIAFRTFTPLFESLCARGVLIRDISRYHGLERCLRVSIGTPEENDRFLEALKESL